MADVVKAADVAAWMQAELEAHNGLYQDDAVSQIEDEFGPDFVYDNDNGNRAISKAVLAAFRKLTGDTVVWERSDRYWRFRQAGDEEGRQQ